MQTIDLGSKFLFCYLQNGVITIKLNRPERRNACTIEMANGIKRAALIAEQDKTIDVLLITGTEDSFCVGGDMTKHYETPRPYTIEELDVLINMPFNYLERCNKIVIAAVNGACHAGGLDMILCADITIASDQATFRAPELLRGIADGWLGARLPQRIGIAKAKHMIFTAATINAIKAESIGLISEVVPHEQLMIEAYSIAEKIKHTGPQARGMLKKQINAQLPAFDLEIFQRSTQSEEAKEGIDAFINKREPIWPR